MTERQKHGITLAWAGNAMKEWIDFNKTKHCQNARGTSLF